MAQFEMIGSIANITLDYVPKKGTDHVTKDFLQQYELLITIESIVWDNKVENQPIIHYHTTFGDDNFNVIGGDDC